MKKIEVLTPEQELYLPKFRQKWLDVGLSCEEADWDKAQNAIGQMYGLVGKNNPNIYWRVDSPMMAAIYIANWANLGANLWDNLWANLWDNKYWDYFWGGQDSYWVAFYKFCNEIGVPYSNKDKHILNLWGEIAESCMWWWPYENVCFVCNRPSEIHKDAQGRLHNLNDMSVKFHDGWGIYNIQGREAPEKVVKTPVDEIPIEWWTEEQNVTTRLQIEQKVGQGVVLEWLQSLDMEIIDEKVLTVPTSVDVTGDKNIADEDVWNFSGRTFAIRDMEHKYELVKMTFPNGDERRALRMRHATTGEQIPPEWVPPETRTVQEALAFRNGTEALPSMMA
jgi:hypothetical protein